ncbi:metallophosphoesterase family protein [Proteiniphilum sp.]|uniref:metallophosphoesterase family protein n=1 Tax=Proteiniphilum sp. TaxID=1926877 RepID=UPI00332702B0
MRYNRLYSTIQAISVRLFFCFVAFSFIAASPYPDRVVLTWAGNPSNSQAVTWRTDRSVQRALAQIAVAEENGHDIRPTEIEATTTTFSSELGGEVCYHSVNFTGLLPGTTYTYRVGDGDVWTEWFHFRTASPNPEPFSFIYFGDAQADIKTYWSRVFHQAFRHAPYAAFTLHAGDLINRAENDDQWGEWFNAPGWVNASVPVIATPGNHEYFYEGRGEKNDRKWTTKEGDTIRVRIEEEIKRDAEGVETGSTIRAHSADGKTGVIQLDAKSRIIGTDKGIRAMTGYREKELAGVKANQSPLQDRYAEPGSPRLSSFWQPQFTFPQNGPEGVKESCYYIDYQGVRIVSLNSNEKEEEQLEWLREVLSNNPHKWTIITFHHPVFSPTLGRDNPELRSLWKPVLDEFKVDLVLTGHDHTYARTHSEGTAYIVSVSGPKLYHLDKQEWMHRSAEKIQLYQIIRIDSGELTYEAYTATGRLYDKFTLKKQEGGKNNLMEEITDTIMSK